METIKIYRARRSDGVEALTPTRGTPGAAGWDLRAFWPVGTQMRTIAPAQTLPVPTGLYLEIPPGYEVQLRCRSGLAKAGIDVAFGTVDSDYRGEIILLLQNHGQMVAFIAHGDRVGQMVFKRVPEFQFAEVVTLDELSPTQRGEGRHGSTGTR